MKCVKFMILLIALLTALLSGCGQAPADDNIDAAQPEEDYMPAQNQEQTQTSTQNPAQTHDIDQEQSSDPGRSLTIICTVFPQYDWTRQILGEHISKMELVLLQDSPIDLHSYVPTMSDMVKIYTSDIFIYVGGESDDWVDDVLRQSTNPDMVIINLMDALGEGLKAVDELEGADSSHGHGHSHSDEEEEEFDEHVWLSLKNTKVLSAAITEALSALDPVMASDYNDNLAAYIEQLDALDAQYHTALDNTAVRTLLFGSRFPFRYMMDDYNLSYYAAFSGCSAETEASFSTIAFLTGKVNELSLSAIMVTECSDQSIAGTIISNSRDRNQQILVLNAMQSVTARDVESGVTYLSIMTDNLSTLQEALK